MSASAIYQRTDAGRMEIQLKKQGLTQSERLVLIVVDGKAPLSELGDKLKVLDGGRISRAIDTLVGKQLIFEVLMFSPDIKVEAFDLAVIDRFLQQDPLDPVTIVSFDADYEYEELMLEPNGAADSEANSVGAVAVTQSGGSGLFDVNLLGRDGLGSGGALPSGVDFYIPLKKAVATSSKMPTGFVVATLILLGKVLFCARAVVLRQLSRGLAIQLLWGTLALVGIVLLLFSVGEKIFQ